MDARLKEDKNGRIVYAGFYSNNEKTASLFLTEAANPDGAFLLTFDEGTKSLKNLYKGFYKLPKEAENLQFRNLIIDDDGSISLFGEQYYKTSTNFNNSPNVVINYYDNIYTIKISANGELDWVKKIPKRQTDFSNLRRGILGPNIEYLSFHTHTSGKNCYLFFIDDPKNLSLPPDKLPALYRTGALGELVCVKLDEKGNITKTSLYSGIDMKTKVILYKMSDVAPNQVMGRLSINNRGLVFNFSEGRPMMISVE